VSHLSEQNGGPETASRKPTHHSKLRADGRAETPDPPRTDNPGQNRFFHHWTTQTSQPERTCATSSKLETSLQLPNHKSKVIPNFQAYSAFAVGSARSNYCLLVPNKNLELEMKTRSKDQALTGEGYVEASLLHGVVGLELQPGYVTAAGQRGGDLAS